jgi:hypothetical protein
MQQGRTVMATLQWHLMLASLHAKFDSERGQRSFVVVHSEDLTFVRQRLLREAGACECSTDRLE